ncbi:MAG: hypothetical protein NTZ83_01295 [Candidatus Pacearchaeota archaeon]|nr:hypothetical protein [Candidatus Pacearchaeota archaeon]
MKKPYIKKIMDIAGYEVWYVNGYYIRKHLDRAFPNYGGNRNFVFIPKNEFWIDYENGEKEARYFVDTFLALENALEEGKSHKEAIEIANKKEKSERDKSKSVKKLKKIKIKEELLKKIHKKPIFEKYTKNLKIWIVKGSIVRDLFDVDFNQGGHDKVYAFIPENEIWIDDSLYRKEIPYVLIHELHERKLMFKGWQYDSLGQSQFSRKGRADRKSAHFAAEKLEFLIRNKPKKIKKVLLKEIKANEKLTYSKS